MRAKIQSSLLNHALSGVAVIVETAELRFGPEGIRVQTVDRSNVGAVEMTLMDTAFKSFSGENTSVHVDLQRINSIIQKIDPEKEIILEVDEETRTIFITSGEYDFEFGLIDPTSARSGRRASDISPPVEVEIDAMEFTHAISLAGKFSDEVILGVTQKHSQFYINSLGDVDKMSASFGEGDDTIEKLSDGDAHAIFGLNLLSQMVKQAPNQETITLELGKDYPAKIEFPIANGNGKITYGLAPRISRTDI